MMPEKTLLLNQGYQPIKVISWMRAICLWCRNKAEIIESFDVNVNSPSASFKMPAVIRLLHQTKMMQIKLKFSRSNIYKRDNYICQYCGDPCTEKQLTLDHIIPKSMGGRTTWTNIASACMNCNTKKANRTPQQAGMKLIQQATYPGWLHNSPRYFNVREIPPEWEPWLQKE